MDDMWVHGIQVLEGCSGMEERLAARFQTM